MFKEIVEEISTDWLVKCDTCNAEFNDKSNLKRHITGVHERKKPFLCEICNKNFRNKYDFNRHLKTKAHNDQEMGVVPEKQSSLSCKTCNAIFDCKETLQIHEQFHVSVPLKNISENQTTCSEVLNSEVLKEPLKKIEEPKVLHKLENHDTPEINIPLCSICNYSFLNSFDLMKHISLVHNMEMPYQCKICDASYKFKKDVDQHMISVHEDNSQFNVLFQNNVDFPKNVCQSWG